MRKLILLLGSLIFSLEAVLQVTSVYQKNLTAVKTFTEAEYKEAYSADWKNDELETMIRYYYMGHDNIFRQVQLNRKSVAELYPEKKELIENAIRERSADNEELMISLLDKL